MITYDPTLVMLAIFVAITGAVTGLTLTVGFDQRYGHNPVLSLLKGAIVMGLVVWATHFVAIIAARLPVPVGYSFVETMVSLYAAIIGAGLALYIVRGRSLGPLSCAVGGILMGGTVIGVHYIAIDAIRGVGMEQRGEGLIVAGAVAVMAFTVALWLAFRRRGIFETLTGGALLGAGMATVHLTALSATTFTALYRPQIHGAALLSEDVVAYLMVAVTLFICGLFFYLFAKLTLGGLEERPLDGSPHLPEFGASNQMRRF
jgi:diguanylate cyclase